MFGGVLSWLSRLGRGRPSGPVPASVFMAPVASSNVRLIGFDVNTNQMYVTFWSGSTYVYDNVPLDIYRDFMRSRSKGRFMWRTIRGYGTDGPYRYRKVR